MTSNEITEKLTMITQLTTENLRDQVNDGLLDKETRLAQVQFLGEIALQLSLINKSLRTFEQQFAHWR
jgi:predicted transcriptional regulator